jgi:hypothetical protein
MEVLRARMEVLRARIEVLRVRIEVLRARIKVLREGRLSVKARTSPFGAGMEAAL